VKSFNYESQPDGTWKQTVTDVPDDDTPQKQRVKAMAEAQPGRIVVGWQLSKSGEVSAEQERYLDELTGKQEGEPNA
jgi:hypothetical protein